jgi:hypothetical protein
LGYAFSATSGSARPAGHHKNSMTIRITNGVNIDIASKFSLYSGIDVTLAITPPSRLLRRPTTFCHIQPTRGGSLSDGLHSVWQGYHVDPYRCLIRHRHVFQTSVIRDSFSSKLESRNFGPTSRPNDAPWGDSSVWMRTVFIPRSIFQYRNRFSEVPCAT